MAIKSDPKTPLNPFADRSPGSPDQSKAARKPTQAKPAPDVAPSRAPVIEPQPMQAPDRTKEPLRVLSPGQISAARSLIGMSQTEFGAHAGLSRATISRIEEPKPGGPKPTEKALRAIVETIEAHGVIVMDEDDEAGIGVRLAKGVPVAAFKFAKAKTA